MLFCGVSFNRVTDTAAIDAEGTQEIMRRIASNRFLNPGDVMTKKWWEHDDDILLEDVKTHAAQLRFSRMMHRRWSEIGPNEAPDAILDFERFPIEDVDRPWLSPEYASSRARSEEEKQRVERALARETKRQANRRLYGKSS